MTASVPVATSFFYTGDGSTTGFSFPLRFLENADVQVYVDDVLKTLTTHYSLTGAGGPSGGTVTFVAAPAADTSIELRRDTQSKQTVDLSDSGRTPGDTLEGQLDRLAMATQDVSGRVDVLVDLATGPTGPGVPAGGAALALLSKTSSTDYDTQWLGAADVRGVLDAAPYVATRTALKALDTTKDTVALLNGFAWVWSAGDFSTHITTDTQEGMFIKADAIASTSGAWRRAFVGAVHASWFGVDATASAAANKTALNAALAMSVFLNGGVVELPAGIISCNTGISHAGTKPLILRGQGMGVTTLNATAGANFMSIVPSPFSAVNIVFEDLTIEQAGGATTNAGLLVSRCTFRAFRVAVRGFAVGMYLDETYSFDIVECMFSGQATYGVQAVANTANNAAILRTFFGGIGKTGFGPALFLDSAEHILIQGNQFEDNYRDIRIDNCGSVAIIDNYMEYEDDYPINFVGTNSNVVIQRNWIALFSSTWTLENVVELTMTDNFLHDCTTTIAATCLRPIVERNKKTGTGTFPSVNVTPRVMESVQLADRTGSDVSTAQAVFASAQDALTVEADATYEFEAEYFITRAAGTTSHTTGVLFGGSATFDAVAYLAQVTNPTGNVLANVQQIWGAAATEVVLTAANTSATENLLIKLKGRIRTNAAGTIIPQFKYSAAPGGAPTIKANSAFRLWYLGSDQVAALGPWA